MTYLNEECIELFDQLCPRSRRLVIAFMNGLLKGTEKEKPPADVGASTSGI